MGMSASQARLISLEARMSDTEYEAQQINQQRLTLSNQMNKVQEAMYSMEVPTPPSKIDYMEASYIGTQGGTEYKISMKDGKPTASFKVTGSDIVKNSGSQKVDSAANPMKYLEAVEYSAEDFTKLDPKDYQLKVVDQQIACDDWKQPWAGFGDDDTVSGTFSYTVSTGSYTQAEADELNDANLDTEGWKNVKAGDLKSTETRTIQLTNKTLSGIDQAIKDALGEGESLIPDKDGNNYVPSGALKYSGTRDLAENETFESGKSYVGKNGNPDIANGEIAIRHNSNADALRAKEFVVKVGNDYQKKTGAEVIEGNLLANAYTITEGNEANYNKAVQALKDGATGLTVGGNPTMSIDDAEALYGTNGTQMDSAFVSAINGLKNSFPDTWQNYTVIVATDKDGNHSFSFCQTADLNDSLGKDNATTVWTPGKGDYWKECEGGDFDAGSITYGAGGTMETAMINGETVILGAQQNINEGKYEEAVQRYNNDKAVYDKEQNELNKKTSIYQRQDKLLELKLTRLDSERNALNTEIEAVKKVIQDSIDRGFKTFSG